MRASIEHRKRESELFSNRDRLMTGDTDDGVVTRSVAYLYEALQKRGRSSKLRCAYAHSALHKALAPIDTCTRQCSTGDD